MVKDQQLLDRLTRLDELMLLNAEKVERTNELLEQIAQAGGVNVEGTRQDPLVNANPASSLAMRGGWSYDMVDIDGREVEPGGSVTVNNTDKKGFILSASGTVVGENGGLTQVRFKTDDYSINTTIRERFIAGVVTANSSYDPFVPVYNSEDDIYSVSFSNINGYHFKNDLRIELTMPANADSNLEVSLGVVQVIIDDMEKFMRVDDGS